MKIPRRLILLGEAWDVELVDCVEALVPHDDDRPADDHGLDGYCDPGRRLILIDRDADEPARVVFHEAIHAALPHWPESRVRECEDAMWPVLRDSGIWRKR